MADNFEFLKNIDKELFNIIQDAQKLFRDEYFNQCAIQLRIFAENIAKKTIAQDTNNMTFDDVLNCLKDKIKTEREKEFINDLFFIKKEGNACAHGEETSAIKTLEMFHRIFEVAINYVYFKKKDEKIDKLRFDDTLLITQKRSEEIKLVDKYLKAAHEQKEEILKQKENEFFSKIEKSDEGFEDKNSLKNPSRYKKNKKKLTPTQEKIKTKIKQAKKNLKENINKTPKIKNKKKNTKKKNVKKNNLKHVLFIIFVLISLILLLKMLTFF